MTLKVTIVVGNPKPQSRTLRIAEQLARKLLSGADFLIEIIDLAEHTDEILKWPSPRMEQLNKQVAESNLVLFASPTYKATFTGLLKTFLDRYPANALHGVVAIPVMTGADDGHSMAPVVNLAPLLTELGATVPFKGFYFSLSRMNQLDELIGEAVKAYALSSKALLAVLPHLDQPVLNQTNS